MGLDIRATWERRCQKTGQWVNMEDEVRIPVLEGRGRELLEHLENLGTRLDLVPEWNQVSTKSQDKRPPTETRNTVVVTLDAMYKKPPDAEMFGWGPYKQALKLMSWCAGHYELHGLDVRLICWGEP